MSLYRWTLAVLVSATLVLAWLYVVILTMSFSTVSGCADPWAECLLV